MVFDSNSLFTTKNYLSSITFIIFSLFLIFSITILLYIETKNKKLNIHEK